MQNLFKILNHDFEIKQIPGSRFDWLVCRKCNVLSWGKENDLNKCNILYEGGWYGEEENQLKSCEEYIMEKVLK